MALKIMQGDQYALPIDIKNKETGADITDADAVVINAMLGKMKKTSKDGGINYSPDAGCWLMHLTQQDTFSLPRGMVNVQIRVKMADSDDIIGERNTPIEIVKSDDLEVL